MLPLALLLRKNARLYRSGEPGRHCKSPGSAVGLTPNALLALLSVAGLACCVAMSMPQVHIVGLLRRPRYGAARGAEMLAVMLGFGIVSAARLGWICDPDRRPAHAAVGSVLQGIALVLFLAFRRARSLYVVSALFGLFRAAWCLPTAIIVREYFSRARLVGASAVVLLATLLGMAAGGWASGAIFDLTGSYRAASPRHAWNSST